MSIDDFTERHSRRSKPQIHKSFIKLKLWTCQTEDQGGMFIKEDYGPICKTQNTKTSMKHLKA